MARLQQPPAVPGIHIAGPLATCLLGMVATLITTGIIATVSLYGNERSLTQSVAQLQAAQQATQTTLTRHLDNAVDKNDYLRDKAHTDAMIEQMATKEDLRLLREMILQVMGSRGDKYRKP